MAHCNDLIGVRWIKELVVSENVQASIAAENGRPTKAAPPPVIRRLVVAEEDRRERLFKRQVPAWTISGAIHVVLVGVFVLFFSLGEDTRAKSDDKVVTTAVEDPKIPEENLTNPDQGFDADLKTATDAEREEKENVEGKVNIEDPIGQINNTLDQPVQTFAPPGVGAPDLAVGATGELANKGAMKGEGGGDMGSQFMAPGMKGRSGATKDALLRAGGGNKETEAAVARGLAWLAKQQKSDGRWQYDGASKDDIAATGMSLLPFLAAGETHKSGKLYKQNVAKGLAFLTSKQNGTGTFTGSSGMYAHAIATIAMCEAYGMTNDPALKNKVLAAVKYIEKAQGPNGSWGYTAGVDGDTSIVGWQVQALKSAEMAGLYKAPAALKKAEQFLIFVSKMSESRYGYNVPEKESPNLSAVGLLCRQYMGWGARQPSLAKGVEYLLSMPPDAGTWNMYYYYYATQVVHFFEGDAWFKEWNPKMQKLLLSLQAKAGANTGSWDKDGAIIGEHCGRLGTTCLALLTLEVYYRHLPLYKRDNAGRMELEN
jgi:hypothetical protein